MTIVGNDIQIGIVGAGLIGLSWAGLFSAFGYQTIVYDPFLKQKDLANKAQEFSEYSLLSSFHVTLLFFLSSYKNSLSVPLFTKFLVGPFLFRHLQSSLWVTS